MTAHLVFIGEQHGASAGLNSITDSREVGVVKIEMPLTVATRFRGLRRGVTWIVPRAPKNSWPAAPQANSSAAIPWLDS